MRCPPKEILYISWSLHLLPADELAEGCQVITTLVDPLAVGPVEPLNRSTHYLRSQWVPLADVVLVHGTPIRTNNVAEGSNGNALRKLAGSHPEVWPFMSMLCVSSITASIKMIASSWF